MSFLHINIKISLPGIHVQPINSYREHEGLLKSSCEIAGAFKVMSTEVKVDIFLVYRSE